MKNKLVLAIGLLIGLGFLYGGVGSWIGVAQAEGASRTPGVVRNEQCGYRSNCGGDFTSDDGSIHEHVVVSGGRQQTGPQRAVFVRRIGNGLDGAIQSEDTAYVGSVSIGIVGPVIIAVILTLLGLLLTLPYLVIGLLYLGRNRRQRTTF